LEAQIHAFFTSALDGRQCVASQLGCFKVGPERAFDAYWRADEEGPESVWTIWRFGLYTDSVIAIYV
jgi:hypothetical protein